MALSKKASRRWRISKVSIIALIVPALLLSMAWAAVAADKPGTVAEIALYQGPDREKILIEGARKEGEVIFYTIDTWLNSAVMGAFGKKYPFINVKSWRNQSTELLKRVTEEYAAGHFIADVVSISPPGLQILLNQGIYQEFYSPEMEFYSDEVKERGKTGVYYIPDRENHISLGFNTKLVPPDEAPKNFNDLLDPKWNGKMSITGTSTGIWTIGNMDLLMGRDFVKKLSAQNVRVQNISGAALAGLVASGEVPLSPSIFDSNVFTAKKKGAPLAWRPLEPVVCNVAYSGMTTKAPHPYAAMLLIDFIHSKEGQEVVRKGGQSSAREGFEDSGGKYKKIYMEKRFKSLEEYEKKYNEWQGLLRKLFIKK